MIPRPRLLVVVGALLSATLLTGCGASTPLVATPTVTATSSDASGASGSPGPTAMAAPGQTDTDWGRIWDRLPSGFPAYPGSTASNETGLGPASAVSVARGADPATIISWYQTHLEGAGFATDALSGPMEDGSYTLDSSGPPSGCRLEITVAPLGADDIEAASIMYGAACPNG